MENNYIYKPVTILQKFKIPEGKEKCPICNGSGQTRIIYGGPYDNHQFGTCATCIGKGYADTEWLNHLESIGALPKRKKEKEPK